MYNLINNHIDQIIDVIDPATHIEPYIWLVQNFDDINVATHEEFQKKYRAYWQLNAARLSDSFCNYYFELLQHSKANRDIKVQFIARQLLEVPSHNNGHRALQFSFASKLAHMIDHNLPIYDSMVEGFYFLPAKRANESTDNNLARLVESYEFLIAEYARVLRNGLLSTSIDRFRHKFSLGSVYTDIKIIDTLIWRFVSFMKDGATRTGKVIYG